MDSAGKIGSLLCEAGNALNQLAEKVIRIEVNRVKSNRIGEEKAQNGENKSTNQVSLPAIGTINTFTLRLRNVSKSFVIPGSLQKLRNREKRPHFDNLRLKTLKSRLKENYNLKNQSNNLTENPVTKQTLFFSDSRQLRVTKFLF